jgi:hypothetical protein
MKLRRKITRAEYEALSEDLRENYAVDGDQYVLAIEGMHHAERLAEHKRTNDELKKKLADTEAKFNGVDPDRYRALETELNEVQNGKGEKVRELVDKRLGEQKATYERQLAEAKAEKTKAEELAAQRLKTVSQKAVKNYVFEHAAKAGVAKTALTDVYNRAQNVFRYDEERDEVLPYKGNELWTEDGYSPIKPEKYFGEILAGEAPHLFEASSGAGSKGSNGKGGGVVGRTVRKSDTMGLMKYQKEIAEGTMTVVDG